MTENQPFDSKAFLAQTPHHPGVYRMQDSQGDVIYVGKAKDLKKRLSSYFRRNVDSRKTQILVSQIAHVEYTLVNSETEALILENNLIKALRPKYNVLLRDDKSYPYILLSEHRHPRLAFHRGPQKQKGRYFGPFPSGTAVRASLSLLQKVFAVRQCEDSYYRNRTRPCLQYQLGRCTAPCVGYVSDEAYQKQVKRTRMFLEGQQQVLIEQLVQDMEKASGDLDFEEAARLRDQIAMLRQVQEQQGVSGQRQQLDVFVIATEHGLTCVQVLSVRGGKLLGSRSYFPKVPDETPDSETLSSFIMQFYLSGVAGRQIPEDVIVGVDDTDTSLPEALSEVAGRKVRVVAHPRGEGRRYLDLATMNLTSALANKLSDRTTSEQRFAALRQALDLAEPIKRMECFDISHTQGERTVASCVVFNGQGPAKSDYRRFNINGITPGDDYAAMTQALQRRYRQNDDPEKVPDILFIDGGKGQLSSTLAALEDTTWPEPKPEGPLIIGVAKGESRKPGLETLIVARTGEVINLKATDPALHLIQHIRDEAHRFAITGHRQQRAKVRKTSTLESIPGVGDRRRQALLKYLGGLQGIKNASVDELCRVPGISRTLAQTIYDHLQQH